MPKQTFYNLSEEKRERIVNAAIEAFAENDYAAVSISQLVEEAGIAKGSFYQYFEDKEDLLGYLLELTAQKKVELIGTLPPAPEMGVFAYLRWLAKGNLRFELAYPRLSEVAYRAMTGAGYPPVFSSGIREQSVAFFRQLVAQGKAQGDIAPEINEELAAHIFNSVFSELGKIMLELAPKRNLQDVGAFFESAEVQELFEQTLAILEKGMGTGE